MRGLREAEQPERREVVDACSVGREDGGRAFAEDGVAGEEIAGRGEEADMLAAYDRVWR